MKDRFVRIIKDYLTKEYGNENALPKPVLDGLADALDEKRFEIFERVKEEYVLEDVANIEENMGVKFTDDEVSIILHRLDKCDNGNYDLLCDIADEVIDERGQYE